MNRKTQPLQKPAFLFLSGSLWLDFVNTVIKGPQGEVDLLETSAELRKWLIAAKSPKQKEDNAPAELEGANYMARR